MSVTKMTKGAYIKRQFCDKCDWLGTPSPLMLMRECCPNCGNSDIKSVIGRYIIETTKHGIWPFSWIEERYVGFEKKT